MEPDDFESYGRLCNPVDVFLFSCPECGATVTEDVYGKYDDVDTVHRQLHIEWHAKQGEKIMSSSKSSKSSKPGRKPPRYDQPRSFRIANRTYRNWGFAAVHEGRAYGEFSTVQAAMNSVGGMDSVKAIWYGDGFRREFDCAINLAAGVIEFKPAGMIAQDGPQPEAGADVTPLDKGDVCANPECEAVGEPTPHSENAAPTIMDTMPAGGEPGQSV